MNKNVWDILLYGKEYIILPTGWYHLRHGYLHLCLPVRKNGALLKVFVKKYYRYRLCKPWTRKLAVSHKIGNHVVELRIFLL
jgi:hypothetical protein